MTCAVETCSDRRTLEPTLLKRLRSLFSRVPRHPRPLALEELSRHRLRDLGLADGHAVPQRDPIRD
jgi:hypothetical protein